MKISQLEYASKIMNEIKDLDKEIILYEKFAMELAEFDHKVEIKISSKNMEKSEDEKMSCYDDSIERAMFNLYSPFGSFDVRNKYKNMDSLKDNITIKTDEKVAISVPGTLLMVKQHDRAVLINKLKKLNIEI